MLFMFMWQHWYDWEKLQQIVLFQFRHKTHRNAIFTLVYFNENAFKSVKSALNYLNIRNKHINSS